MKAGREFDALVAEKVMGWIGVAKRRQVTSTGEELVLKGLPRNDADSLIEVPRYSTRIDDAWSVVEKMRTYIGRDSEEWDRFVEELNARNDYAISKLMGNLNPEMICHAALVAVGAL